MNDITRLPFNPYIANRNKSRLLFSSVEEASMANSVGPDKTAPIGAVCSGSKLFAFILKLSVKLGKYLQQTTSSDIFRSFFLGASRVNIEWS